MEATPHHPQHHAIFAHAGKWSELVNLAAKVGTMLGVLIILFLNSRYVTRDEFSTSMDKITVRITRIEEVLIRMEAGAEADKRHDQRIDDHEQRLRRLERGTNFQHNQTNP